MFDKEALSRIKINKMLELAGWRLLDTDKLHKNIICEATVRMLKNTKNADYLLLDIYNRPIAVIEAKAPNIEPLSAKIQVRKYAEEIKTPFAYLSNGDKHYFWNIEHGNPDIIATFHSVDELMEMRDGLNKEATPSYIKVWNYVIDENCLAELKHPNFMQSELFMSNRTRSKFLKENKLKILRGYQLDAIKSVQQSAKGGSTRFLLEMATGTGKTLTCSGLITLFLQTKSARRVLFLVDRIELEQQSLKAFNETFDNGDVFTCSIFKDDREGWIKSDIVISTVQTLCKNERYIKIFSPSDFDLVIVDEAHRSISGDARKIFEYFVGYKIGLTATPKNFFRGIDADKLKVNNVYKYEERILRDTYITFGCEPGKPTYSFTLKEGVRMKILNNPFAIDARTKMTVQLFSKEGLIIEVGKTDEEEQEEVYEKLFKRKDYEKKLFSENTNISFCKAFIKEAKRDPISGEIGKTIVYCVSQKHASKITNILNKIAHEYFPDKYKSDFAVQITSDAIKNCKDIKDYPSKFNDEGNNLGGKSKWLEDYDTCKTRICVTVAMMTTGYDCKDLLNIVLMRPILSPSEFIQIKGRGTRIFDFEYKDIILKKDNFYLFDFFANCEYFEVDFKYDKPLNITPVDDGKPNKQGVEIAKETIELNDDDPLHYIKGAQVDDNGMRVDRDFYNMNEVNYTMSKDYELKVAVHNKEWNIVVKIIENKYLIDPKFRMLSKEHIGQQLKLERIPSWQEFVELVFGLRHYLKTRTELLEEAVEKCITAFNVEEIKRINIRKLVDAYVISEQVRDAIDNRRYAYLDSSGIFTFEEFKQLGSYGKDIAVNIKKLIPEELLRSAS